MNDFPATKFDIIYADPPWCYRGRKQFGFAGDVAEQYSTLTVKELSALRVTDLAAEDCLLYLWATSPLLEDALDVMRAWDFEFSTVAFVWDKVRTNPGYYTMSQAEFVLVGKQGKIPLPRGSRNERQWFYDHMPETVQEMRTQHSRKPSAIRKRIEIMHPEQRKIELFAREQAVGWTAWGNEVQLCCA